MNYVCKTAVDDSFIPADVDELGCEESQPDISLSDRQELPQYYGKVPKQFCGRPLEDIDPYYKERGEEVLHLGIMQFGF